MKDVRRTCGNAEEIVLVLPRDVDREKPSKGKGLNWHDEAKTAAAPATLTVFHGRTLAEQLDSTCQDLRHAYLGIPYSRVSWYVLIAGCRESSTATIRRLETLGRYDPKHYIDREADERLFALWQRALRNARENQRGLDRETLIPLIADSGIGKTSLVARFVSRTLPSAPVLLLPARDLSFDDSNALVRDVIERLQGSMDATLRSSEESRIAAILQGKTPLTVVLDGLDETRNDAGARQSIDGWMRCRLRQRSILIVSSRPDFWRKCRDATWASIILRDDDHSKATKSLRHERDLSTLDPLQGIELPKRFSSQELVTARVRSERTEDELWKLPPEVRKELLHPFTLKSAVELLAKGTPGSELRTRSGIMALWIRNRLKLEADKSARITESQYRESLLTVAREAETSGDSWVSVDKLTMAPRFTRLRPPGEVVERLIAANILETHPEQHDHIRFSFDAVFDFFLAESKLSEIEKDPKSAAKQFAELPFSRSVTLLERIGDQIASHDSREEFVCALAELDGPKAAAVLRPSPMSYGATCRAAVVSRLSKLLKSRMEAEKALATELLGRLMCPESGKAIESHWNANEPSKRLHAVVSSAAISHGIKSLVSVAFRTSWFTHDAFFVDLRPELFASTDEFRDALADYACGFVSAQAHSEDYRRALTVLAYLGDHRAVAAIQARTRTAAPYFYESACLLAIGSVRAIQVYASLVDRYLEAERTGLEKEAREKYWTNVVAYGSSIGHLGTEELENYTIAQIQSDEPRRKLIGRQLAEKIGNERMLSLVVEHWKVDGYILPGPHGFGRRLGAERWLQLWNDDATVGRRRVLIRIASDLRDSRIEQTLLERLDDLTLAGEAAQSLATIGSERACSKLRGLLAVNEKTDYRTVWNRSMALHALARLRDPASVPEVAQFLESEQGAQEYEGTTALASIGTPEAEQALLNLKNQSDELYVRGLVCCGSRQCVERAVEIALGHEDGAAWLIENCRFSFRFNGWSRYEFRTDVDVEPILNFVGGSEPTQETYDGLRSLVDAIDSPVVRTLFRTWYDRRNTPLDVAMKSPEGTKLSDVGFRELAERGDEYVLDEFIKREVHHWKGYQVYERVVRGFRVFEHEKISEALRNCLHTEADEKARVKAIEMIGYIGTGTDISFLESFMCNPSDAIANAAFDAMLRLSDPLRLAERW